jgi:nitric oxide reductase NorE protein
MVSSSRVPGEPGFWVLIAGDLFVFTVFFLTYAWYRGGEPELFAATQATLNRGFGLLNTVLLLSSSLFVAIGVHRLRDRGMPASLHFLAAILCGAGFVVVKIFEYGAKILAGVDVASNTFLVLYFAFTGIHLAHVLLGLGVLVVMRTAARGPDPASRVMLIECGATFWHVVDLLWIVLFALFYLIA